MHLFPVWPALLTILLLPGLGRSAGQKKPSPGRQTKAAANANAEASASFARKLDFIRKNAAQAHPDQRPTVFTEEETNAYLASGRVKLPDGLQQVHLQFLPAALIGQTTVDFDQLTASRRSSNPLLGIFSGTHAVTVNAHAHGDGGEGKVHIDSMAIDGVAVPRFVLELFMEKFIQPKYPQAGIDSVFNLPAKIDLAILGQRTLTLTQK